MLLITISFIRYRLDYRDITSDHNKSFQRRMEIIQYRSALATTSAIRGKSREKL